MYGPLPRRAYRRLGLGELQADGDHLAVRDGVRHQRHRIEPHDVADPRGALVVFGEAVRQLGRHVERGTGRARHSDAVVPLYDVDRVDPVGAVQDDVRDGAMGATGDRHVDLTIVPDAPEAPQAGRTVE